MEDYGKTCGVIATIFFGIFMGMFALYLFVFGAQYLVVNRDNNRVEIKELRLKEILLDKRIDFVNTLTPTEVVEMDVKIVPVVTKLKP